MKDYIKINIGDIKPPHGSWLSLYQELGILKIFDDRVQELGIPPKSYCLPQHILCNEKTFKKLENLIKESWIWYGINRHTGELKKRSTPARHKNPTKLHKSDECALAWDALGWSPSTVDSEKLNIPDDEIWCKMDIDANIPVDGQAQ